MSKTPATVTVMRESFDRTAWKAAFALRLLELRPDMNPDAADELSDAEFERSKALEPGVAATRWVDMQSDTPPATQTVSNG